MDFYDGQPTNAYTGVSGGFRAGKRRRGNSLLKRKPNEVTRTFARDLIDEQGTVRVTNVRTITYKRPE